MGGYQSGQMGQTVNLLALAFGGSNPSPPTKNNIFRNFIHVFTAAAVKLLRFLFIIEIKKRKC